MPSLLLIVLLLQLAIHLINTIGSAQINDLAWRLFCTLPGSHSAHEVSRLRRDVVKLKREMNSISAQDDFARWARVRRQHDKVLAEHDAKAASLSASKSTFDTRVGVARWLATSGARYLVQFWYAKTPVFELPRSWFPGGLEWVLAFPRCAYGGVSVNVWSMVCGVVVAMGVDAVVALVGRGGQTQTQTTEQTREQKQARPI